MHVLFSPNPEKRAIYFILTRSGPHHSPQLWFRLISQMVWECIAMIFCTNIQGSQTMTPNDYNYPLTFSLTPPAG